MIGFTREEKVNEKRYTALKACIGQYLDKEGGSSEDLIADIKAACDELKEFHQKRLEAFDAVEEAFRA